jgi:ABC-type multidrug transport system fused ATPase/permease subunit
MIKIIKLFILLTPKDRIRTYILLVMILVMALLDAIGIASIMPFIAVLANPDLIQTNSYLAKLYNILGGGSQKDFLLILGVLIFFILLISLGFKALTIFYQLRFNLMLEYRLGELLVERYLHQPYAWFLTRNSTDLGKNILSEASAVIDKAMIPFTTLIAQTAVAFALLTLLVIVQPAMALSIVVLLGGSYILIFKFMSQTLNRLGKHILENNTARFKVVSEAFSAAKEVKIGGLENFYINRFVMSARPYAMHQSAALSIALLPRFALEAIAFGGMMLIVIYLMTLDASITEILPLVSLYAFAGYRLVPAFQQLYGSLSQLRIAEPVIDLVYRDLSTPKLARSIECTDTQLTFEKSISLENIYYTYPSASRPALNDISFTITANTVVGIVGPTGCGKTSVIDLIMGLLEHQKGTLCVDGQVINFANMRQWQKIIGYVPQQIYLADSTIAANIAFGVNEADINREAIIRAAKVAELDEFVINELPNGYDTEVGERGVRLSGGQRQRIGIARALYHNPKILILDEGTSALDNLTELAVMESINNLRKGITIILIAHRLSTVRECDQIYIMENGKFLEQGTYDELRLSSPAFQAMTKVSE